MDESVVDIDHGVERVIRVRGSIDWSNSDDLSVALARAVDAGKRVTVDLSQTDMLDSSAIASLLAGYCLARDSGVEMSLAATNEKVVRVLQMSGFASTFGLSPLKLAKEREPPDKAALRRADWQITESAILAEPELLEALRDLAASAAYEVGLDDISVQDVLLAVTEALANAFIHGSPSPGSSKISLRCLACSYAFVVEIADEGPGVDPAVLEASTDASPSAGVGLRLMKAAMDDVEFFRTERGSYVRMLKWLDGC